MRWQKSTIYTAIRRSSLSFPAVALSLFLRCDQPDQLLEPEEPVCSVELPDTTSPVSLPKFLDILMNKHVRIPEELESDLCQPWDWDGDHPACIDLVLRLALRHGIKHVGLTRGRTYNVSDRPFIYPGLTLSAVGDSAAPRLILRLTKPVPSGIALAAFTEIRNLDIRSPYYNTTHYPAAKHDDWVYVGVNGGGLSNWSILGTSINGFPGTGILAGESSNVRIEGNTISHNGYSGVSLFAGESHCGHEVRLIGNLIEHNGQDGVDACSDSSYYISNIIRYNGWALQYGDGHGLLIFAWKGPNTSNINIYNNLIYGNCESGVRIDGLNVSDVTLYGNVVMDNGQWGISLGSNEGTLSNIYLRYNVCANNKAGCVFEWHVDLDRFHDTSACDLRYGGKLYRFRALENVVD